MTHTLLIIEIVIVKLCAKSQIERFLAGFGVFTDKTSDISPYLTFNRV